MDEEAARKIAMQILDEFEDLLTDKNIKIPSDDREGDADEAGLFGREHSRLQEAIVGILSSHAACTPRAAFDGVRAGGGLLRPATGGRRTRAR